MRILLLENNVDVVITQLNANQLRVREFVIENLSTNELGVREDGVWDGIVRFSYGLKTLFWIQFRKIWLPGSRYKYAVR
jgi:hypothetical protein